MSKFNFTKNDVLNSDNLDTADTADKEVAIGFKIKNLNRTVMVSIPIPQEGVSVEEYREMLTNNKKLHNTLKKQLEDGYEEEIDDIIDFFSEQRNFVT